MKGSLSRFDYNTPETSRVDEIIFTKPPQINHELDD